MDYMQLSFHFNHQAAALQMISHRLLQTVSVAFSLKPPTIQKMSCFSLNQIISWHKLALLHWSQWSYSNSCQQRIWLPKASFFTCRHHLGTMINYMHMPVPYSNSSPVTAHCDQYSQQKTTCSYLTSGQVHCHSCFYMGGYKKSQRI